MNLFFDIKDKGSKNWYSSRLWAKSVDSKKKCVDSEKKRKRIQMAVQNYEEREAPCYV